MNTTDESRAAVRKRLEELERDGKLTPRVVMEDARNPESPLHDEFDWDKDRAAEQHWLDRARELIRRVRYEVHTETVSISVPRYLRDPDVGTQDQGYVSVPMILTDRDRARRALLIETARAESVLRRAHNYAAVLGFPEVVEAVLSQLDEVKAKTEAAVA